jgi:hypothetical protein
MDSPSAPEQQTGARDAKWNARPLYQTAARDAFLTVRALFCSFDSKTLHSLTYKQVASLSANILIERWFDWGHRRIDSLLSDELTDVNGALMEHTYLFVSGTVISIQFAAVIWETTRVR